MTRVRLTKKLINTVAKRLLKKRHQEWRGGLVARRALCSSEDLSLVPCTLNATPAAGDLTPSSVDHSGHCFHVHIPIHMDTQLKIKIKHQKEKIFLGTQALAATNRGGE